MALTDSLISYWKLDEASGNRSDSHGSNTLTDNNTVLSGTGKINSAADFEYSNSEYLNITDNTDVSCGDIDFTFTGWFNLESISPVSGIVLGKSSLTGSYPSSIEYMLEVFSDSKAYFTVSNGGSAGQTAGTAVSTATWYFFVAWHDATANTVNLQLNDGTVSSVGYSGGCTDGSNDFRLGLGFASSSYFDGLIDEVGFWKRVLTSGERTQLYNGGSGLAYPFTGTTAPVVTPLLNRAMSLGHIFGGKCLC